ncbi:glycoside hydrolase superfamily [Protomyces lactucae-debilis]|uniref:Glycoside hydrolase superfamily n=1 Tax=Protomyces lactucae-debilis TaxID=2754530 RepID=A0A1Y2F0F3_PROLT|nr:glycoside hydrolase superfamily [Protomyces lactucae-debilis]ORY77381.1 glycoside hydrolase superfamily [Protomyces lactucae-debilis]
MLANEWKSRSIYQIVTDRFAPSTAEDEARLGPCNPGYLQGQICGGTWQGIIRKLDYIQGMGFDAIWISPITKNIEDQTDYGYAYHGYWPEDLYSINPHFGTPDDLFALSSALHARGMALMVDVVVQHMGSPAQIDLTRYTPFNDPSHYHSKQFITDYTNQTLVEQGWLGNGQVPLPDLNTENPVVIDTLNAWIASLVQRFKIDGLRLDTVKHVRADFWPGFIQASGVFGLGEVLSGDPDYLAHYQPYTGGLIDYATYYPLLRAFGPLGDMAELGQLLAPSYRTKFRDTQLLATFMENHDNPRFPNTSKDPVIVKNALAYTILSDGIPMIYYGQEQGFSGLVDPACREPMWPSGWKQTDLYKHISLLNKARKAAWSVGFGQNLALGVYLDRNILVTQKGPMLLVISNAGSAAAKKTITFPTKLANGTLMVDIFSGKCITVGKSTTSTTVSGDVQVYLPLALAQSVRLGLDNTAPTVSSPSGFRSRLSSIFGSSKSAGLAASKLVSTKYASGIPARATSSLGLSSRLPAISTTDKALRPSSTALRNTQSIFPSAPRAIRPGAVETQPVLRKSSSHSSLQVPSPRAVINTGNSRTSSLTDSSTMYHQQNNSTGMLNNGRVPPRSTTPLVNGRAGVATTTSPGASPGQTMSAAMQARRQHARQVTAPPASLSQHYRNASPSPQLSPAQQQQYPIGSAQTSPESTQQLSSKYTYGQGGHGHTLSHGHNGAGYAPHVQSRLTPSMRSSSESNLRYMSHGKNQGHPPMPTGPLRREASSQSLAQDARSNSMRSQTDRPPMPPVPTLETRKALLDGNAPYAHTFSMSATSLHSANGYGGYPATTAYARSRRNSNASLRSFHTVGGRTSTDAARDRHALLAAETGAPIPAGYHHYGHDAADAGHETSAPRHAPKNLPVQGYQQYTRKRSGSALQYDLSHAGPMQGYPDMTRHA